MHSFVQRLGLNKVGRDFAVGDIHGCYDKLLAGLERLKFDSSVDRLFSVGDMVDRGPDSEAVVELLSRPWLYAVRGNHEQMALDYLAGALDPEDYRYYGGEWFLELSCPQQQRIAAAFDALPVVLGVDTPSGLVAIVHGDCPYASWNDLVANLNGGHALQVADVCMSSRERIIALNDSGVTGVTDVFVGHTPVAAPFSLGNVHYIDTGAVYGHALTIKQIC